MPQFDESPLSPPMSASSPSHPLMQSTSRTSLSRGAPPSAYPFQAHAGNPDPLPTGVRSRRASLDSSRGPASAEGSSAWEPDGLERPYAPFMAERGGNAVYRNSGSTSSGGIGIGMGDGSPRGSTTSFRAPFLSPASRPVSVSWNPPSYLSGPQVPGTPGVGTGHSTPLPGPKPPLPSTLLAEKLSKEDKPWMKEKDTRSRASYWITLFIFILGIGGAGALCWRGYVDGGSTMIPDNQLCSVMSDDFTSLDVDTDGSKWTRDVELGGFGLVLRFSFAG